MTFGYTNNCFRITELLILGWSLQRPSLQMLPKWIPSGSAANGPQNYGDSCYAFRRNVINSGLKERMYTQEIPEAAVKHLGNSNEEKKNTGDNL